MEKEKILYGPEIIFDNLSLKLGGNLILNGVSFTVQPGTIHCILGPNGGGKTSLIRSLLGQMPHEGDIRILWKSALQTTGYVPQALDIDRTLPLTVLDFMTMMCQRRPIFAGSSAAKKRIIHQALTRVNMVDKKNFLFGGLSGGERQRVLLAQALIPEPGLLILDEPTSGLDKAGAAIMRGILEELKSRGTTMLMIHHDLAEVREIGDMVTVINKKVQHSGKPVDILTPEIILNIFSAK
ncbi:MAG: manganese ABC transporter ATP-binding protein [Deltaproteobacteria bacterium]|nr:MAG: manganese ABC transporter ATP-binding protein [Deltaproteobacteria bacterium]